MDYYTCFTFPRGFYTTGLTPSLNISAQYYFLETSKNKGIYCSLGLFGDLGKYAIFTPKQNTHDYGGKYSAGLFLKLGFQVPLYKRIELKGGILLNEGAMEMRSKAYSEDSFQSRNEFIADLGICIPIN